MTNSFEYLVKNSQIVDDHSIEHSRIIHEMTILSNTQEKFIIHELLISIGRIMNNPIIHELVNLESIYWSIVNTYVCITKEINTILLSYCDAIDKRYTNRFF